MMNCVAIDDELNALGIIREFIKRLPDVELERAFTDPTLALQYISNSKKVINIVFLDIQMTRLNGITLAQHFSRDIHIIFTTAYPDYALQGFDMDVVDYLLKPFSFERFERAIQKAKSLIFAQQGKAEEGKLTQLPLRPAVDDFIFVKSGYKIVKVKLAEVLYIEGSGNYVTIHTISEKIMVLQNLKYFETQLTSYQFIRIHRSFIIALNHIDSIEKGWVRIKDKELPVSDGYKDNLDNFLRMTFK